jgi:beta-lactam-binding protein with PASTA domain
VLTAAGFQTATARVDSDRRDGELAGTSPPRGGRAVPGQIVVILISNGRNYTEPPPETEPPAEDAGVPPEDTGEPPVSPGTVVPPAPADPPTAPDPPGNGRGGGPPGRLPPGQT